MTTPTITSPPDHPDKNQNQATFDANFDGWFNWLETFAVEIGAAITWMRDTLAAMTAAATANALGDVDLTAYAGQELRVANDGSGLEFVPPSVPVGTVLAIRGEVAPPGTLKLNGATLSRAAYPELAQQVDPLGLTGDGVTTFELDDMRGESIRGWDDGRGVNPGRAIGSWEDGAIPQHQHSMSSGTTITPDNVVDLITGGGDLDSNFFQPTVGNVIGTNVAAENRVRGRAYLYVIKY